MNSLETLIRLHKWRLDEERRNLAELFGFADDLARQRATLEAETRRESTLAGATPATIADGGAGSLGLGSYVQAQMERRARIDASIAELEGRIDEAEQRVAQAFREVKAYELTLERRRAEADRRANRRDQARLDEVGRDAMRRREQASLV